MTRAIYGIDLGTTYTKCALVAADKHVRVFELDRDPVRKVSTPTLRSAVTLTVTPDGRPLAHVGACAHEVYRNWEPRSGPPMQCFEETKAWIGEEIPDGRDAQWMVEAHHWRYRPEDIAALVLRKVKRAVENAGGSEMTRVVVTHPQFFTDTRRKATRQAIELAGLQLVDTLTEPDAAALAYAAKGRLGSYMVFDIGGGTLDVTICKLGEAGVEVISSAGNRIGGRQFDRELFARMVVDYQVAYADFSERYLDAQTTQSWMRKAEQLKRRLNDPEQEVARDQIRCANDAFEHGRDRSFVMRREDFIAATMPLVDDCVACAVEALAKKQLRWSDVDEILCVGGASRLVHLRAALERVSGRPLRQDIDPDTVVARGAALRGAQLAEEPVAISTRTGVPSPSDFRGVLARGVGVLAYSARERRDVVYALIPGNTPLPYTKRHVFRTPHADQREIPVQLYEGDNTDADFCEQLGKIVLEDCPPGPAGQPVEVEIAIDSNGSKRVLVESRGRRREAVIEYDAARVLPDAELRHRQKFLESVVLCDCSSR